MPVSTSTTFFYSLAPSSHGALQKINTNDFVGGPMELTIVKTLVRTANLRRWLHRPDCPEAVRQIKVLFDKCFVPRKGAFRAYAKHNGVNFSPHTTHKGNANIIYRPTCSGTLLAGQIQRIENVGNTVRLHVRRHSPLSTSLYDPFLRYPHLQAKTYSSNLSDTEDIIDLDDIVAHAARYDYSHGRSVMLNLSRQ
ncbi:hypothetical protein BT96DRAFT_960987 [Gymnopus androsaceus JB14]|uniref:Uncharacterized protein n=1 Tax=Gymnopus androsaceus JB14 TaxID=1447944 RepID=A0A6A4GEA0_9AGAR|nr:hypothetical protein BT96DRAFT_960987 [Gymnopus androsaceus JB14]